MEYWIEDHFSEGTTFEPVFSGHPKRNRLIQVGQRMISVMFVRICPNSPKIICKVLRILELKVLKLIFGDKHGIFFTRKIILSFICVVPL